MDFIKSSDTIHSHKVMRDFADKGDMCDSILPHRNPDTSSPRRTWLGAGPAFSIFLSFFVSQILIVALIQFLVALRVGYLGVDIYDPRVIELIQNVTGHWSLLLGSLGAGLIMVKMTAWASRRTSKENWIQAIGWSQAKKTDLALGFMAGVMLGLGFMIVAGLWFPPDGPLPDSPIRNMMNSSHLTKFVWGLVIIGIAPFLEEFLFRGVMFSGIAQSWGRFTSVLLVTTIFVLVHLPQTIHYKPASVAIALLSLCAIWLRIRTNSIRPAITLHAGYNAVLVAVAFSASSLT